MIAVVRDLLRRKLSPGAYQGVRSLLWYSRYYLPRLIASIVVRRRPQVQGFPRDRTSQLVRELRAINAMAPTEMCRLMTRHGSDKGHSRHNYTTVYSALFSKFRERPLRIFELGLGTNNPAVVSNMGLDARPGASLRAWRALFPRALVYGADIDRGVLFEEDRISTFYCDQLDNRAIRDLWSEPAMQGGMDIIIDDGLHTFAGNSAFLKGSLEHLRPGGIYVIEDILKETIKMWHDQLDGIYSKRLPDHEFAFVELPNPRNSTDNNLLIIRRPISAIC